MAKTSIALELTPDEMDELTAWFDLLGLSSDREITAHLTRVGRIVQNMTSHRYNEAAADNSLYSIARAWILGKYRLPRPDLKPMETPIESYQKAFGMGKAESMRYFANVGLLVHELAMGTALDAETFAGLLFQVIRRLVVDADPAAPEETVREYKQWQSAQDRQRIMGQRREL